MFWRLNNRPQNKKLVNNEVKDEIKHYLQTNIKNEYTPTHNLWDTEKAVLRRKFTSLPGNFKEEQK